MAVLLHNNYDKTIKTDTLGQKIFKDFETKRGKLTYLQYWGIKNQANYNKDYNDIFIVLARHYCTVSSLIASGLLKKPN